MQTTISKKYKYLFTVPEPKFHFMGNGHDNEVQLDYWK